MSSSNVGSSWRDRTSAATARSGSLSHATSTQADVPTRVVHLVRSASRLTSKAINAAMGVVELVAWTAATPKVFQRWRIYPVFNGTLKGELEWASSK